MAVIFKALSEQDVYERYGTAIDLLHWVLVRLRDPYIKSIKKESVSFIIYMYVMCVMRARARVCVISNYINFVKFFFYSNSCFTIKA